MELNRKQKLVMAEQIVNSDEWLLLVSEFNNMSELKRLQLRNSLENGETNKVFFNEGVRAGIEYCLGVPDKLIKENTNFFNRLNTKLYGGVKENG